MSASTYASVELIAKDSKLYLSCSSCGLVEFKREAFTVTSGSYFLRDHLIKKHGEPKRDRAGFTQYGSMQGLLESLGLLQTRLLKLTRDWASSEDERERAIFDAVHNSLWQASHIHNSLKKLQQMPQDGEELAFESLDPRELARDPRFQLLVLEALEDGAPQLLEENEYGFSQKASLWVDGLQRGMRELRRTIYRNARS